MTPDKTDESCATCKFYKAVNKWSGKCRRCPPRVFGIRRLDTMDYDNVFPTVDAAEWCGEYKEDKPGD